MARLLIVHHTPSPAVHSMLDAAWAGATNPDIDDVEVATRAALGATASDVLAADAYLLGTPANLGYISGALKHFFDTIYYPCLTETVGRPFGLFVHGNDDTGGATAAVTKITTGLRWRQAHEHVTVIGAPGPSDLEACWDLGATLAANLTSSA